MKTFTLPNPEHFALGEPNLTVRTLSEIFSEFHTKYADQAFKTFGQVLDFKEDFTGNSIQTPNDGVEGLDAYVSTGVFNAGGVDLLNHSLSVSEDRKYLLSIGAPVLTGAGALTVGLSSNESLTVPTQMGKTYRAELEYHIFTVQALSYVLDRTLESFTRMTAK